MNPFSMNFVSQFAELLTTALMHFVWQGAVLALVLLVTVKLLDVKLARNRYLLSVGTLLAMGVAPLITALLQYQGNSPRQNSEVITSGQSARIVEEQAVISVNESTVHIDTDQRIEPAGSKDSNIEFYVLSIWLVGVLILSTRLAIGFGVTLWIRASVNPLSEELEQRIRILGQRLNVDVRQRVFACARVGQAVAVGFIRPVVLIPTAWLTQLTPEILEAIIAHELAHIRRWDLWVNLVQRFIETLLFYHPAVWWLSHRIRLEREMCCDEIAAGCFERVMYARCLETVAAMEPENLLLVASIDGGNKTNLLNRIRYLLGGVPSDASGNWWAVGFVGLLLFFAAAFVFSLSSTVTHTVAIAGSDSVAVDSVGKIDLKEPQPDKPVEIVTSRIEPKTVTLTQQYVGQIHAHRRIKIRATAKGHLEEIPITEGQRVREGDLLFMVRPLSYQLRLDAENADTKLAQLEYNHTKKLFDDKVVSLNEVQLSEARLQKAQAKSKQAAEEFRLAAVRAPFDGMVDRLQNQKDSLVLEGDIVTTLSDNSGLWVYFNVPEARYFEYMNDSKEQREDQIIELVLSNGKKFPQAGKIGAIEADFNSETGTIPFRADFPNPDRLLRHGQKANVLMSRTLKDAIAIPQRATFEILSRRFVYVVDNQDVAHQREIVIQNEFEDLFVISKGLEFGDRIIVEGIRQIRDGEKIKINDRKLE